MMFGGTGGGRTRYLRIASAALSQMSYNPAVLVELMGLEPTTFDVPRRRSPN